MPIVVSQMSAMQVLSVIFPNYQYVINTSFTPENSIIK